MFENINPKDLEDGRKYLMSGSVGGGLPIIIDSGKGAVVTDIKGKEYIDCTSQAWTFNIGVAHPRVKEAAKEQIDKITHVRTSFETVPKLLLLKKLGEIAPKNLKKISFCLHGSLANESAMKLAITNNPEGMKFLTPFENYSGRTLATIAASWSYHPISKLFAPYMEHVVRIPNAYCYRCPFDAEYPECGILCAEYVKTMIERGLEPVIAIIMEPMQASGGMIEYPEEYLKRIRKICDEFGILLIFDEIQTAFGRLGVMFASELYDVYPDILVFGKAIAGGFPLAGVMQRNDLKPPQPATDSFTFAHFPVSFAAACATLDVIKEENLLEKAVKMGKYFTSRLKELQKKYEIIGDIRGPGLMIGIELVKDKKTKEIANDITHNIVKEAVKHGVIFGESKFKGLGNVLKIKPPLVISESQADRVLEVFEKLIKKYSDKS
ncbi:MAG: aspartate aminotransferase family protein [Spirochaetota bacterium]|nr:MAG: aspartate aminotransferase family protein [Spirochaetota bacterium]